MSFSTGVYALHIWSKDTLTYICFWIFFFFLIFFFAYIILLTFLRKKTNLKSNKLIKNINYWYQGFCILFKWILFPPFYDICLSFIICGGNFNYLDKYRTGEGCSNLPFYENFLGFIGAILCFLIVIITNEYCLGYRFLDKNGLKGGPSKFNHLLQM